jgi:hypothetical protein
MKIKNLLILFIICMNNICRYFLFQLHKHNYHIFYTNKDHDLYLIIIKVDTFFTFEKFYYLHFLIIIPVS